MKKLSFNQSVVVLMVISALVMIGYSIYHEVRVENFANKCKELNIKKELAENKMKIAEEQCFWYAVETYERCIQCGGEKYITEITKSLGRKRYGLEYYKAAINDMRNGIEDYMDCVDDCDYTISLENAVKAEAEYDSICYEYEKLTY